MSISNDMFDGERSNGGRWLWRSYVKCELFESMLEAEQTRQFSRCSASDNFRCWILFQRLHRELITLALDRTPLKWQESTCLRLLTIEIEGNNTWKFKSCRKISKWVFRDFNSTLINTSTVPRYLQFGKNQNV